MLIRTSASGLGATGSTAGSGPEIDSGPPTSGSGATRLEVQQLVVLALAEALRRDLHGSLVAAVGSARTPMAPRRLDEHIRPFTQPARPSGRPYDFQWHGLMGLHGRTGPGHRRPPSPSGVPLQPRRQRRRLPAADLRRSACGPHPRGRAAAAEHLRSALTGCSGAPLKRGVHKLRCREWMEAKGPGGGRMPCGLDSRPGPGGSPRRRRRPIGDHARKGAT